MSYDLDAERPRLGSVQVSSVLDPGFLPIRTRTLKTRIRIRTVRLLL